LGIAHRSIRLISGHNRTKAKSVESLPSLNNTLGDWIQGKRIERNLAPHNLAKKMGVSAALVKSWENGACQPDRRQLQTLREFLVQC